MRFAILLLGLAATCPAEDAANPRMILKKEFPGSKPPYMEIRLSINGQAEYLEAADDDQPVKFKLGPNEVETMFLLVARLQHFTRPLESGLKVARVGDKTFTWIKGNERHEVKFNYTVDPDAQALQDWFEKISETQQHVIAVERAVRFDKLGVNKVLLQFQAAMERGRVVASDQFLPWLDRVAKNESYLNMARERAAALAAVIRSGKVKPAE